VVSVTLIEVVPDQKQYSRVNPMSSPNDHCFHSKVPNSKKGGGGGLADLDLNTKLTKRNCKT